MTPWFSFTDSTLFFGAVVLALLWLLYEHHTERFQRWLFGLTVAYSTIAHFLLAGWVMVEGLALTPLPWVAASIVLLVLTWAVLKHELRGGQFLFYLAASSFPLALVSLSTGELVFGDLWLTALAYLCFTIPAAHILRHHALKLPVWVAYVALGLLGVYRFVGAGQFGLRKPEEIDLALLLFCAAVVGGLAAVVHKRVSEPKDAHHFVMRLTKWQVSRWVDGAVLGGLLIVALIVSGTNLSGLSFQNDEFFHVETAQGLVEEGDFVRWDSVLQEPQVDEAGEVVRYDRARPYTVQTAAALRLFGMSESALRLPSVLWFLVFLTGAYVTLRLWTKNIGVTLVTVLAFVFLDHFILHARLVRMYSMLLAVSSASMVLWYLAYRASVARSINWKRVLVYGVGALSMSWLAVETHRLFLLFAPAFLAFLVVEWLYQLAHDEGGQKARRTWWWLLGSSLLGIVGLGAFLTGRLASYSQFFGWRSSPNFQYEIIPFSDQPIVALALVLYFVGLVYAVRLSSGGRFVGVVSVVVIMLFTFTVKRYNAMRYIIFILPMALTVVSLVLYLGLERLNRWLPRAGQRAATVGLAVLLFVPLTFPGVSELGGLFYEGRADRVHANGDGHDVRSAYAYIKSVREPEEPLFVQSFRSVYWDVDPSLAVIDLGTQEEVLPVKELKELTKGYEAMWFVWPEGKSHHLTKKVKKFIANRAEYLTGSVPELMDTNVEVYYWERGSNKKR